MTRPSADDFTVFADMVDDEDDGSVPVYGWRVLMFMDHDGVEWFKWQSFGDPPAAVSVGTMELVKHKILMNHDVTDAIAQAVEVDKKLGDIEDDDDETDI